LSFALYFYSFFYFLYKVCLSLFLITICCL
jgi:hypothetical protein